MIKKEDNTDKTIGYSNTPSTDEKEGKAAPASPKEKSTGERLFDWGTYGGIGFGLNLGLSVIISDYFLSGKGMKYLDGFSKGATKLLTKPEAANAKAIEERIFAFSKTNLLLMGGNILMIPVKVLEDNKRRAVYWLNRKLGCQPAIMKDGHEASLSELKDEELPTLYEDSEKQTWGNVVKRRLMGISATLVTGTLLGKDNQAKVEHAIADKMVLPAMESSNVRPIQNLARNDLFQRYTRLVALDQFFTIITSAVTYLTRSKKDESASAATSTTPDAKSTAPTGSEPTTTLLATALTATPQDTLSEVASITPAAQETREFDRVHNKQDFQPMTDYASSITNQTADPALAV